MHGDRLDNVMVPHDFPVHLVTNADRAERAQRAHGMSSASTGSRGSLAESSHFAGPQCARESCGTATGWQCDECDRL